MNVFVEFSTYAHQRILTQRWKFPDRLCTRGRLYKAGKSRQASRFSVVLLIPYRPETRRQLASKSRPGKSRRVNVNFAVESSDEFRSPDRSPSTSPVV